MADKEKPMGLPETGELKEFRHFMKAGLYPCRVREILTLIDDKGEPKLDKNGNPGLKVIFYTREKDKDGNAIEPEAESQYYYSPYPVGDPRRDDPNKICKSEFKLTKLKAAMGFGTRSIKREEVLKAKVWVAIKLQEFVDQNGKLICKEGKALQYHVVEEVFPYTDDKETNYGRPELLGDPTTDQDNFTKGYFYEKKLKTVVVSQMDEQPRQAPQSSGETAVTGSDVSNAKTSGDDW